MVIGLVSASQILAGTTNTGSGHRDVVGGLSDGAAWGGGAILRDVHVAHRWKGLKHHPSYLNGNLLLRLAKTLPLLLLRLTETLPLLLPHDDLGHTADGMAPSLLRDLGQRLAALLPHQLATACLPHL